MIEYSGKGVKGEAGVDLDVMMGINDDSWG